MNNQFSYELDERQIRIMLRDGEAEIDSSAWNRFEQLAQPDAKPRKASFSPRFNVSISRSVLVPLIFVVLIGGLSATLFSFVDFKKKDVSVSKNTLEPKSPDASVNQPSKTSAAKTLPINTASATPEKAETVAAEKIIATSTPTVQQPAITHTETKPAVQKTETILRQAQQPGAATTTAPPTVTASNTKIDQPVVKKRKQKKVVSEEIPTINTSSTNLNQASEEPELELR
jgi:hypothetical protein